MHELGGSFTVIEQFAVQQQIAMREVLSLPGQRAKNL
jgi:hypothetical protein